MLRPFIEKFVIVYLDYILLYSRGKIEQHTKNLELVFVILRGEQLFGNLNKCLFFVSSIVFLYGRQKIKAIRVWPDPRSIHDVRNSHGLASFSSQFI